MDDYQLPIDHPVVVGFREFTSTEKFAQAVQHVGLPEGANSSTDLSPAAMGSFWSVYESGFADGVRRARVSAQDELKKLSFLQRLKLVFS